EAGIRRPQTPEAVSDAQWADYLFLRDNPRGRLRERWVHVHGCRRWFDVERDTVSHAIAGSAPPGQPIGAPRAGATPGSDDA
ncbi:MAG: sarcosine oxidase subunit delta, partial [Alphaproteobacteria bacterium]